jgi:Flp pilus assembly protein TadG
MDSEMATNNRRVFANAEGNSRQRQSPPAKSPRSWSRERGSVTIMTAILLVGLVFVLGLSIDVSRIYMVRSGLQNAADAAALAAARELNSGTGGLGNAVTQAKAIVNSYGLSRTSGSVPNVTISKVEFSTSLAANATWYDNTNGNNVPAGTETSIKYVRVTTQAASVSIVLAVQALGTTHIEQRTATAGMSPAVNTVCNFFPITVALDNPNPLVKDMTLTFIQGDPGANTIANQQYILIDVPQISGNGEKETVLLAAGVGNICQTINVNVPFHITPSGNKANGPKAIAWGANSRFDNPGKNYVDPAIYPPDNNVNESITFDQYKNKSLVTPPPHNPPGVYDRRILIAPIVTPGTYQASPGPPIVKFGAFFLKSQIPNSGALSVEWIDEALVIGQGGWTPGGGTSNLSIPVLYK